MPAWLALLWFLHTVASSLLALHGIVYATLAWRRARLGPVADLPLPEAAPSRRGSQEANAHAPHAQQSMAPQQGAPTGLALPAVTVQVACRNEGPLVAECLEAVARLDWPAHRLEVQLLDDSDEPDLGSNAATVERLRGLGVDIRHLRREARTGFKAGALQNGLEQARGDILVPLDADFLAPPDLLRRLVPHFADASVACVQARWSSRNPRRNLMTRAQELALAGHFAVEQRVRAEEGSLMSFNSTACAWRKTAIRAAGGWPAGTLAEDLDLSVRVLLAGGRFVYLEDFAVPSLLPEGRAAFADQQVRWARGSMQNARQHTLAVLASPILSRRQKASTLHHLWHYSIHPLVAIVVASQSLLALATDAAPWVWLWVLPAVAGPLAMYAVALHRLGPRTSARLAHLPALAAVGLGLTPRLAWAATVGLASRRTGRFVRTRKGATAYRPDAAGLAGAAAVGAWAMVAWPLGGPFDAGVLAFGACATAAALWP